MNIKFLNIQSPRQVIFCANSKRNSQTLETEHSSFPMKRELTEAEKEFNEVLLKYNTVSQNIKSQKDLLKTYYSSQDKFDYQMLLKEKSSLSRRLKRIAKKAGTDEISMEMDIIGKKEYNRYAPKVFRAKTISQLDEVQKLISDAFIFVDVKATLLKIISIHKDLLKNIK